MSASGESGKRATLLAFGQLLKRLRVAADLTQEELAERAMLSARSISDLERGSSHRPRRDTVALLADGLQLAGAGREAFVALARGRSSTAQAGRVAGPRPRHRLPHPPTPIVGRLKEIAAATAFLLDPSVRLLTLTGPGGVGKTRLAQEVASRVAGVLEDGVVFVDLAPLRDPELLLSAIAQALDVAASADLSLRQAVSEAIAEQQLLLVLDNFEHLAPAAAVVADLLAVHPALTVLATSRVPLHIRAEREYPLGPLALPERGAEMPLDDLARVPAIELFVRRAEAVNLQFALTPGNAPDVAAIAVRLDGLPLAIELAATRLKVLSPAALLARLEQRLPLLTGGAADLPIRQRTMRATLDWSYGILSDAERALFRRLSVFAGGCTLEGAEHVGGKGESLRSGGGGPPGLLPPSPLSPLSAAPPPEGFSPAPPERSATPSVLDLLAALIDKSLLLGRDDVDGGQRVRLLETIREYGLERLQEAGEEAATRASHAAWCLALAQGADAELTGPAQAAWLARLTIEHDNLRAALAWAIERGDGELAQRLGGLLSPFWISRGHFDEGRRWLEQALALEAGVAPATQAGALLGLARLTYSQGRYDGEPLLEEALALFRQAGDTTGVANVLGALGMLVDDLGEHARSSLLEEEALALFRSLGDQSGVMRMLISRGLAAYDQGLYDRSAALLEEALALARALGAWHYVALSLNNLALVMQEWGDLDRAVTLQTEALDHWLALDRQIGVAHCLENLAMFTAGLSEPERAARLFGAAEALRAEIGVAGRPSDQPLLASHIDAVRAVLGEATFIAVWERGRTMPREAAIADALGEGPGQVSNTR